MPNRNFRGLFAMAVTPFDERGEIDFASIPRLCDFYIARGATAMIALGIMGEAHRLAGEESARVARAFLAAIGARIPIYFGVSSPALRATEALAKFVMDLGAAGVMLAPLANQKHEGHVLSYLQAATRAIGEDVPLVFQDYPQETGTYLSAPALARIVESVSSICALKHEDCPGLGKISFLRAQAHSARVWNLPILVGNGALYLPQELARGANGAMTGFSYPEALAKTCALYEEGQANAAEDLFDRFLPLLRYEQQPQLGLAVRKHVLKRRGAIACAKLREPGYRLDAIDLAEIDRFMSRLGRVGAADIVGS